ncbi:MAG: hypothetical protein JWL72_132 [Ilumatobacteraceae bacterium]|nr:hypothetical protein [Ilumatobacteraceae bacterium]MCU1386794.1 hypothetical protein [Ilumatobacteraceae bacterium]
MADSSTTTDSPATEPTVAVQVTTTVDSVAATSAVTDAPTATDPAPTSTTASVSYGTPAAPIVVVTGLGVLGWWDGSSWIDTDALTTDIPVSAGVDFTTFTNGPDVGHATSTGIDLGCEPLGSYTVVLDPPTFYDPNPQAFAVNATWNLFPRPVTQLDTSNAEYTDIVRQQLIADGLPSPNVRLDQLIRTDLDGDGTDEVLIAASHPDLDTGLPARAGWFSIVMLRQVVGATVQTTELASDIHLTDDPDGGLPNTAQYGFDAVADFNGDGHSEFSVWGTFWEGAAETVYTFVPGAEPVIAVEGGCGS